MSRKEKTDEKGSEGERKRENRELEKQRRVLLTKFNTSRCGASRPEIDVRAF